MRKLSKTHFVKFTIILLFLFLQNCQKESDLKPTNIGSNFSFSKIESIKNWFEREIQTKNTRVAANDHFTKTVDWNKYFYYNLNDEKVVLVPITYNSKITPVLRGSNEGSKKKKEPSWFNIELDKLQYLLIRADGTHELLTMFPTDEYLQKSNKRKKSLPFSGYLIIENWAGELRNGFKYDNGKPVAEIKSSSKNGRVGDYIQVECSTIDIFSCGSGDGGQTWNCQYSYTKEVCSSAYIKTGSDSGGSSEGNMFFGGAGGYGELAGNTGGLNYYLADDRARNFFYSLPDGERDFYLKHPYLILGVALNRLSAMNLVEKHFGSAGWANNDNGNAYFHAIWSYLNALIYTSEDAREIGDVHERFDPTNPAPIFSQMDRHNNSLGIRYNDTYLGMNRLLEGILNGEGKRIVDGQLVPTNDFGFIRE